MAALLQGRITIRDSAGAPVSGGKLRIYNANTTTLTTVYSDAALSVPLTNPVVADSSGLCPQIWAAQGTTVDYAEMTSGGVILRTAEDAVFVGSDTGALVRDLTNSRFQVRNSGGVVQIETGDATGDDVGGSARFGGWNGTQGDTASIDYASVGVTGVLTESNGKKLQGVVYTPRTTFSAVSNVVIPLSNQPSGVIAWAIDIYELLLSADANIVATLSFDNGATYKASYSGASTNLYTPTTTSAAATMPIMQATSAAGGIAHGMIHMHVLTNTGTKPTVVSGTGHGYTSTSGAPISYIFTNYDTSSSGRATHLKLAPSAGNISGAYRVVPLRGYE